MPGSAVIYPPFTPGNAPRTTRDLPCEWRLTGLRRAGARPLCDAPCSRKEGALNTGRDGVSFAVLRLAAHLAHRRSAMRK
jgi:hypothetical protein